MAANIIGCRSTVRHVQLWLAGSLHSALARSGRDDKMGHGALRKTRGAWRVPVEDKGAASATPFVWCAQHGR